MEAAGRTQQSARFEARGFFLTERYLETRADNRKAVSHSSPHPPATRPQTATCRTDWGSVVLRQNSLFDGRIEPFRMAGYLLGVPTCDRPCLTGLFALAGMAIREVNRDSRLGTLKLAERSRGY